MEDRRTTQNQTHSDRDRTICLSYPAVLYVEGDDNDVVLMRHAWKRVGVLHPLQVATDGDMALRYLSGIGPYADRVAHPLPCLALIDLKLPKGSGFDLLRWIRGTGHPYPTCCRLVIVEFRGRRTHRVCVGRERVCRKAANLRWLARARRQRE
jgi:CheY-like chemotaxis protein